jgi:rSAM/selenodomain-associated transferase 2
VSGARGAATADTEPTAAASDRSLCQLSVVIPCWNDARALAAILATLKSLDSVHEVIVADASRDNECRSLANEAGVTVVVCDAPNRGAQMNAGAQLATGEVLLFQHADTELTQAHLNALLAAMCGAHTVGGAFHRKFDARHSALRWLEPMNRLLTRCGGTLCGDQSIFVRRSTFESLGGFAAIPLMEDVEFSRRLRRAGPITIIDRPIASSARHHLRRGAWRTSLRNAVMIALVRLGMSPQRLHAWYYRDAVCRSTAEKRTAPIPT